MISSWAAPLRKRRPSPERVDLPARGLEHDALALGQAERGSDAQRLLRLGAVLLPPQRAAGEAGDDRGGGDRGHPAGPARATNGAGLVQGVVLSVGCDGAHDLLQELGPPGLERQLRDRVVGQFCHAVFSHHRSFRDEFDRSVGVVMSGRRRIVAEELAEPGPGPRQARAHDGGGQPEHLGDLARLEPLPQVELEHLLVAGAQPGHRRDDVLALDHVVAGVRHVGGQLAAQPVTQGGAAPLASTMVREHPARDAVQPRTHVGTLGRVRQPPPRDEERVGGDVTRVLRSVDASQRVTEDRVEVGGVEVPERAFTLVEGEGHVSPMSGRQRAVAGSLHHCRGTVYP